MHSLRLLATLGCTLVVAAAASPPIAVPTFHSIGLTWKPRDGAPDRSCRVQFRPRGESTWREGLPLWFDPNEHPGRPERSHEYRGSLVHLQPDTTYEVRLTLAGGSESATLTTRTWSETFPVARTVQLPRHGTETLVISEGGSAQRGYVLYEANPAGSVIDVDGVADVNVRIDASFVIVRGLTLRGARRHGIELGAVSHVLIEDNDISGWGANLEDGWGRNFDSAIFHTTGEDQPRVLRRIVVQRNRLHHPRSNANAWTQPRASRGGSRHPIGPQGITFIRARGEIVLRHNDVYSDFDHMFNDGFGAYSNFSYEGFPVQDADIYGNRISHCWDDGLEIEGANVNVRVWGNVIDWTFGGIGAATTSLGPLYLFRNLYLHSRKGPVNDADGYKGQFLVKLGTEPPQAQFARGRIYIFHNTSLQPPPYAGFAEPSGAARGLMLTSPNKRQTGIVSRNNVIHLRRSTSTAVYDPQRSPLNDFDYDLYSGVIDAHPEAERHGIRAKPSHAVALDGDRPWSQPLVAGSPGHDVATPLPNFNDRHAGDGPDMGAIESDLPLAPWWPVGPDRSLAPPYP